MDYKSEKQKEALEKQGLYLQKFNQEAKKIKPEQEQEIIDLYLSGKSSIILAKMFNCSKPTVLKVLKNTPKTKTTDYPSHRCHNQFGEKNASWKGGIKTIYDTVRGLSSYWKWRDSVLDRDGNHCTKCGTDKNLHSHHMITLKSLINTYCTQSNKLIKDLTEEDLNSSYFYDIDNGLTLCEPCHKDWHKQNGRK